MTNEQSQAVFQDNGNMLVSASAGSGKTFTMIERLKRLVIEQGVGVDQILAVTFTEMAASEMKEKLKSALSQNFDEKVKDRMYRQLSLVPSSDISTLHAFCARLIRSYFFAVGLSPDFSVMDEADAQVLKNECIEKTFREFYDSEQQWFYTLIDRHASKRTDGGLKQMVLSAYTFCDAEANPFELMDRYQSVCTSENCESLILEYKNALNAYIEPLIDECETCLTLLEKDQLNIGAEYTNILLVDLKQIFNSQDVYCIKKPLQSLEKRINFEKKLTSQQLEIKEKVKLIKAELKALVKRFASNLAENIEQEKQKLQSVFTHTQDFVKIVKRFAEIYSQEKRQENALDFNDLEHFALEILKVDYIRQDVKNKYKYIFVDEYQDINAVQESIISLLSNDNLFMVGDVKQSIYGFRGCRPEFFSSKFENMKKQGQTVLTLNHNFRSCENVIEMVNTIFNYSMTKRYFGFDYKDGSQLVSGGVYPEQYKGRATLHLLKKQESEKAQVEKPRIYNILQEINNQKEQKDNHLASLVTEIINDELGKEYYDVKEKKLKRVEYKDITILTRNKGNSFVAGLVKGLALHGIPVTSAVKENVCDYKEILMMINALKLVDCFSQDIPLATTLKSPVGGFNDEDLAQIVCYYTDTESAKENPKWTFINAYEYYIEKADTDLSNRLKQFKEYFDRIRIIADFVGAEGVLNTLVDDKHLESYLFAEHNGKTKVNRVRRFIMASIVNGKKLTVSEFLQKIENSPESFNFAQSEDEQAVKVMTIHASKGLEFPVVIACGLERTMNSEEEHGDLLFSRQDGFAFSYFDDQKRQKSSTIVRGVVKEKMRLDRIREELRLFYVALTRATYSLHLTVEGDIKDRKETFMGAEKFIDYVPNTISAIVHDPEDLTFTERKAPIRKVIIGQSEQSVVDKLKKTFAYQYPHELDTELPLKTGVTSAITYETENVVHMLFDEPTPDIERGVIAHAILENFNFNSQDSLAVQVGAMVDKGIITKEQMDKVNLTRIENAISCESLKNLRTFKLYREKQFLVNIEANKILDTLSQENVLLQGVIDLLAIDKDKAIIVDYKYSSLDKNSLKVKYAKQLELYAYAVNKVLGANVEKRILLNLFTGESIEV
ncbi:MAG: hypothetical protein E7348_05110 [Clostridiales bacterium]|nr:hypothetical protein [Clostridiales bacterium]